MAKKNDNLRSLENINSRQEVNGEQAKAIEAEKEKAAAINNDMQMQNHFFALRERFFVLLTEKSTGHAADFNFRSAHTLAKMDFFRRCEDARLLMEKHEMNMPMPKLYDLLKAEA